MVKTVPSVSLTRLLWTPPATSSAATSGSTTSPSRVRPPRRPSAHQLRGDAPLQEEPEDTGGTQVYLGFRCDDTQGWPRCWTLWTQATKQACFFPLDELERED